MATPFHLARRSSLFVLRCPLLLSPCSLFPYVRPCASRSSSRHVVSLCVSSRASRCVVSSVVPPCRPSRRLVGSSRRVVSYGHRFALLFACSRFACRGVLALRSRVVSFSPWHPVSSLRLVHRLVGSSRYLPSSRFCLTRGRLGSVLVPGSRVRAVPFCCSLVSVRLSGLGSCPRSWGGAVLLWP